MVGPRFSTPIIDPKSVSILQLVIDDLRRGPSSKEELRFVCHKAGDKHVSLQMIQTLIDESLKILIDGGTVNKRYQVKDSDGVYLPAVYKNLNEIPKEVEDDYGDVFPVQKHNIVEVYCLA